MRKASAIFFALVVFTGLMAGSSSASQKQQRVSRFRIARGKAIYYANQCGACHLIGKEGCKKGVPLDNLPSDRTTKFIVDQIMDPEEHVKRNAAAFDFDPNLMPRMHLSKANAQLLAEYILSVQKKPVTKRSK